MIAVTIVALAAFGARPLRAQAPATVPPGDPAYAAVDRLAAAGVLDTVVLGLRPYTRDEFARIAKLADREFANRGVYSAGVRDDIAGLLARFAARTADSGQSEPWHATLRSMTVALTSTNARPRFVPPDTGIGGTDAIIQPLTAEAAPGGRDAMQGSTMALESDYEMMFGGHLAFDIAPRLRWSSDTSYAGEHTLSLRALSVGARFGNVLLSMGRQSIAWGSDARGGAFLADGAPPMDMVRIANDHPLRLPGWLGGLGPASASFFVADLGVRQVFPHGKLAGYALSVSPSPSLELGAAALDFFGGSGAPTASFAKRVENLFLFPVLPTEGYQFSNTFATFEARYRTHWAGNTQLYWELNLDDFDHRRLKSSLWKDDAAHVFGVSMPAVGPDGRGGLAFEYRHTGTRFGRHLQFTSGPTQNGFLLGEPLGPDADGAYLFADVRGGGVSPVRLRATLADETYRNDQYYLIFQPFSVNPISQRPRERRLRAFVELSDFPLASAVDAVLQAGVERVQNADFAAGAAKTSGLFGVVFRVWSTP